MGTARIRTGAATGTPAGQPRGGWTSTAWSPLLLAAVASVGLVLAALAVAVDGPVAIVLVGVAVVVALAGLQISRVRVRVDAAGLSVRFGPWGWPRQTVPIARIAEAEVVDVHPSQWGGIGYRVQPRQQVTAVVLRSGPGLLVRRRDGRCLVLTIRDPQTGAGVLNGLVRAEAAGQPPVPPG
ncbi:MAG: hypothetical protein ACYCXA_04725 [Actinomycetes bacterium]